jgi:transcriptional regulator with XRE-family HTH domain
LNIKKYIHKKQIKIADGITRNKWDYTTLAKAMGVSRYTLYKWRDGITAPDVNQAIKLAEFMGVSFAQLIKEENNGNT